MQCRPSFTTLKQAQQRFPFLTRVREQTYRGTFAFGPLNDMPCWIWVGYVDEKGYGRVQFGEQRAARVHRVTFELLRGGLLEHHILDHLCRNRACCNPWHLQAVTQTENTQRGARASGMCRNGLHPMTGANVIVRVRDGLSRYECAACKRARQLG